MDNLKMHTPDLAEENFKKLAELFPDAVTETKDENGKVVRAIDADVLRQEISTTIVEGQQERYQFTWPDKKKAIILANQPIAKTLRLDRNQSVGRDGNPGSIDTENIYIEGDNLDALKLLQETYLGKVKMVYIDPPYNTGSDSFVYDDDSSISGEEFSKRSGQRDKDNNLLYDMHQNNEANGRFHTDWLNMIYPRLRLAKDLLCEDGVICISIDDHEVVSLIQIGKEIFGAENYIATLVWKSRQNKDNRNLSGISVDHEYIVVFSKNFKYRAFKGGERDTSNYRNPDNDPRGPWTSANMAGLLSEDQRPNCHYDLINPNTGVNYGKPTMGWRYDKKTMSKLIAEDRILWPETPNGRPRRKVFLDELKDTLPGFSSVIGLNIYTRNGTKTIEQLFDGRYFEFPKPVELILELINQTTTKDSLIMDFFSGSATTAHAVMQLNEEDGGQRKYILIQLPESCNEKSEAYKAGYKNICEIGEERIRLAGKKIKEENPEITNLDVGFRVFYVDDSNMKDVYYRPADYNQDQMELYADNIKPDRTPEDLLIQVMLDLGILLSSKIVEREIGGKSVFDVADGYLIACFDNDITEEVVTEIAKQHPFYAVFRDSGMANDSVMTNFDQIFETYSPRTQRKVL